LLRLIKHVLRSVTEWLLRLKRRGRRGGVDNGPKAWYDPGMDEIERMLMRQADKRGVVLSADQVGMMGEYVREVMEWNRRKNLVAAKSAERFIEEHVGDAMSLFRSFDRWAGAKLVDIGSGAGLPGVPLKVMSPELDVTIIESSETKAVVLERIAAGLDLGGVRVLCGRAEDMGRLEKYRGKFDLATARAVGSIAATAELALPLLMVGGLFLAQRGKVGVTEFKEADAMVRELGGEMVEVKSMREGLGGCERQLLVVKKRVRTPDRYPRSWKALGKLP
jgi:16S rRNA (guanine527-N7)-methyltransferase